MAKKKVKKKAVKKKIIKKDQDKKTVPVKTVVEPAAPAPKITPHPTAGQKVTQFEKKLDDQLAQEAPKRGPGRPPKEPPPEPPTLDLDVVAGVIKIPFELWAIGQGVDALALTDEESRNLAEPAKILLEYYLPQIPEIAYAWIGLSVSSFWIMRTRLLLLKVMRKERESQKPAVPRQPTQPGVNTTMPEKLVPQKV